mmetsp:Transcript_25417/g.60556  ORF Transcript_25417/g.60556 Transcript_25417/m.60556 type:complete len:233 (+) Transcript_25417:1793-2491(+)
MAHLTALVPKGGATETGIFSAAFIDVGNIPCKSPVASGEVQAHQLGTRLLADHPGGARQTVGTQPLVETAAAAAGERITVALAICRAWSTVSVTEKAAFIGRSPNLVPVFLACPCSWQRVAEGRVSILRWEEYRQGFIVLDGGCRRRHAVDLSPRVERCRPSKSVAERFTGEHQVPHGQIDIWIQWGVQQVCRILDFSKLEDSLNGLQEGRQAHLRIIGRLRTQEFSVLRAI